MYADSTKEFKKIYLKKEMILKFEVEINNLNRDLDTLKEAHTSLIDELYNVLDTLVERIEKVGYVACPSLKLEIETLKGQLIHASSLSCTSSSSSSDSGTFLK